VSEAKNYRDADLSGPAADPCTDGVAESVADVEDRTFSVDAAAHGQRLDKILVSAAGEFSRSHLQRLIAGGEVRVDGAACTTPARKLRAGQQVHVTLRPTEESQAYVPEPMDLGIVYEDDDLLVLDKPAGRVVHPAPGHWRGTVLNGLLAHHAAAASLPRAGIVHRLDKDTSGLMVVAKSLVAMTALVRAMAERGIRREYLAIAHGMPRETRFSRHDPVGRDPASRIKMAVVPVPAGGKPARTDFTVFAGVAAAPAPAVSLWHCRLHTGRTHQIRVHAAAAGHPLVADASYGGAPVLGMSRQALHAARLALVHPRSGVPLAWVAPLPTDLAQAWRDAGGPPLDAVFARAAED
jgi:23S rRNA pseudouridine1911/1915/1917 synthase